MSRLVGCGGGCGCSAAPETSGFATCTPATAQGNPGRDATTPMHRAGGARTRDLPPWQRVKEALQVDPLQYLHTVGRLSGNARPSSLQPLLKRRQHTLSSSLCTPHLDLSGLLYSDIQADKAGSLAPTKAIAQSSLTLGTVSGVPESGVTERKSWLNVARMCLYDGARFHGNVQAVKPREVKAGKEGATWLFDAVPFTVQCPQALLNRMSVYIEFNVSYELTPEEISRLPAKPERAARQVDEIAVAWALVELRGLPGLKATKSMSIPLRGGPLAQRMPLWRSLQPPGQPAAQPAMKSVFGGGEPSISIKLSPVSKSCTSTAPLPAAAIASPVVAKVLGLYRKMLAEGLGCTDGSGACTVPIADQALASFPTIMDDPDLSHAFFQLWEQQTGPRLHPTIAELKAVLRQCAAMVWMMMGSQAIPAASIANHIVHQWGRKKRMTDYLQVHPVAALNTDAHQWLHAPFNAAELVCDPLRNHATTV